MIDKKDKLIKELNDRVNAMQADKKDSESSGNFSSTTCLKCGIKTSMSFTLPAIKASGLCASCYNE